MFRGEFDARNLTRFLRCSELGADTRLFEPWEFQFEPNNLFILRRGNDDKLKVYRTFNMLTHNHFRQYLIFSRAAAARNQDSGKLECWARVPNENNENSD